MVTSIHYDEHALTMALDFCNWMQADFTDGMDENIPATLSFYHVPMYDGPLGEIDYYSILRCRVIDGNHMVMALLDDFNDRLYEIEISSDSVDISFEGKLG